MISKTLEFHTSYQIFLQQQFALREVHLLQGVQTLSVISNFDFKVRKIGEMSKVKVFPYVEVKFLRGQNIP